MADLKTVDEIDSSADLIECPRGWLLVQNEESGLYHPFFVKVREDDIAWDMSFPNDAFSDVIAQFNPVTRTMYRPGSKYVLTGRANGERYGTAESWVVTLYKDMTAQVQKRLILDKTVCEFDEDSDGRRIIVKIKLPFKISATDIRNFSINVTKSFNTENSYDALITSAVNTRFIKEYDESDVNKENPFYSYVYIDLIALEGLFDEGILPSSVAESKLAEKQGTQYNLFVTVTGTIFETGENSNLLDSYRSTFGDT